MNNFIHIEDRTLREGVTTITSQLSWVKAWDIHKLYVHNSNYIPCNFDSFGTNIAGDIKEKSIISYIERLGPLGKVLPAQLRNYFDLMYGTFINFM